MANSVIKKIQVYDMVGRSASKSVTVGAGESTSCELTVTKPAQDYEYFTPNRCWTTSTNILVGNYYLSAHTDGSDAYTFLVNYKNISTASVTVSIYIDVFFRKHN